MKKVSLFLTVIFGGLLVFLPIKTLAGAVSAVEKQSVGISVGVVTNDTKIENPIRSEFSFLTSISIVVVGFWAMFATFLTLLRKNLQLKNRLANFLLSPRLALTSLALIFGISICGNWLIPPTVVSAANKHTFKLAENAAFASAEQFGGEGTTQIGRPVFDNQGNQYIYGAFIGTLTIGETTLEGTKDFDMFVAKLDSEGNLLWMRHGSGVTEGVPENFAIEAANSLAVDETGNVYVGGGFVNELTLDGGKNKEITLNDTGGENFNYEPYLAKFTANGDLLWAKGGASGSPQDTDNLETGVNVINQIVFDSNGNPYIAGIFSGTNFLGSAGKTAGMNDAILAKINPANGTVTWKKIIGGESSDDALSLGIDGENNLYLLGVFASNSISISSSETYNNALGVDTFIAKFDSNGGNLWAQQLSGEGVVIGNQLAVNADGEVLITGLFTGSLPIETKEKTVLTENESGRDNATFGGFVAKLDENGDWVWAESFGGLGSSLALDENGKIYVVGTFFGDSEFGEENLKSQGSNDQFISAYTENGELEWSKPIPGSGVESENIFGAAKLGGDYKPLGVEFNPQTKSIFITGDFSGNIKFDETDLKTEGDDRHAFLAEISEGN